MLMPASVLPHLVRVARSRRLPNAGLKLAAAWVLVRHRLWRTRLMWGMARAQVSNLVEGVTAGYTRKLEINGVGYKAAVQGKVLQLSLGYSHDVPFPIPDGITVVTPRPVEIHVSGIDKRQVGQVASEIRAYRPPEPYKGKGVKYSGEFIFRKEGKKK